MNIREKLERTSWCRPVAAALRQELDALLERGVLIPEEPGGWWHQYVCPEHHTELLFDPAEENASVFLCPRGCRIEGDAYRGAWLVFKHQSIARYALQSAAVYAAFREPKYAELGLTILSRYAAQFPKYPVHPDAQPWMLKGRAFHQALTEAIWSTTLIRAYLLLKDEGVDVTGIEPEWSRFLAMFEESMTEYRHILIHDRKNPENNYTAWLNGSLAGVYAARGERGKLEGLLGDEGGLQHHLTIGVKADGFEFEGSTYYHVFVLRAYLIAAEMAERFGIDVYRLRGGGGQTFESMFDALAGLANEQGELPALHDGPYKRIPYAREIAEIMEIGLDRYRKAEYVPVLAEAYRQLGGAPERFGLEAVVYGGGFGLAAGAPPARPSLLLQESGFAVCRKAGNPLSFLIDFGAHGGSHGHYDKLHVSIEHGGGAVSPDMGMVPYGSSMRKGWFAQTASHNTFAVGGKSQREHQGELVKYEDDPAAVYVWARSADAYDGCIVDRHVRMTKELVLDWTEVRLDQANTIDLSFHSLYPFAPGEGAADWIEYTEPLGGESGYEHVRTLRKLKGGGGWARLRTGGADNPLYVTALLPEGADAYLAATPGDAVDPSQPAYALVQRANGTSARFVQAYSAGEAAGLEWDGDRVVVRIGGQTSAFVLTDEGLQSV